MTGEKQITTAQDVEDLIDAMMRQEGHKKLPPAFACIFYLGLVLGGWKNNAVKLGPKEIDALHCLARFGTDKRLYSRNPLPVGERRMQNVMKKVLAQLATQKDAQ